MDNSNISAIHEQDIKLEQHPQFEGVNIAWLINRDSIDNNHISCAIVEMNESAHVKAHTHPFEDDIVYCLRGSAKIWIEGRGDVELEQGSFVRVPAGVGHRLHSFANGFKAFDIFAVDPGKFAKSKSIQSDDKPVVSFLTEN